MYPSFSIFKTSGHSRFDILALIPFIFNIHRQMTIENWKNWTENVKSVIALTILSKIKMNSDLLCLDGMSNKPKKSKKNGTIIEKGYKIPDWRQAGFSTFEKLKETQPEKCEIKIDLFGLLVFLPLNSSEIVHRKRFFLIGLANPRFSFCCLKEIKEISESSSFSTWPSVYRRQVEKGCKHAIIFEI